ncbi:hypothetical protein E2C01_082557 [Portunus trituberculatus]|nr:hypothetical protein [Portunus trituberculatus]
MAASWSS